MKKRFIALLTAAVLLLTAFMPVPNPTTSDTLETLKSLAGSQRGAKLADKVATIHDALNVLKYLAGVRGGDTTIEPDRPREIDFRLVGYQRQSKVDIPSNEAQIHVIRSVDEWDTLVTEDLGCFDECDDEGYSCCVYFAPIEFDEVFFKDEVLIVIYTNSREKQTFMTIDSIEKADNAITLKSTLNLMMYEKEATNYRVILAVKREDLQEVSEYNWQQRNIDDCKFCENGFCFVSGMNFVNWLESKKYVKSKPVAGKIDFRVIEFEEKRTTNIISHHLILSFDEWNDLIASESSAGIEIPQPNEIDESFFENNAVIAIYPTTEGIGYVFADSLTKSGDVMTLSVISFPGSEGVTGKFRLVLAVNRADLEGINRFVLSELFAGESHCPACFNIISTERYVCGYWDSHRVIDFITGEYVGVIRYIYRVLLGLEG